MIIDVNSQINKDNALLLRQLALYLNLMPDAIDAKMLDEIAPGMSKENREYAFAALLAVYCGFDTEQSAKDKAMFHNYFTRMIHRQEKSEFIADSYYKNIRVPNVKKDSWELKQEKFKPCEAFLADESMLCHDGRLIPQIGFFEEEFSFPAALQDGREWMTVTPHEIRTTVPAVRASFGNVLTYGLGLGYFAYMASEKENVETVTVVEKDKNVIELFEAYILPQFGNKEKIKIHCADAFDFAEKETSKTHYDVIFADTWHDPSDGVEMYKRFVACEKYSPDSKFFYWIEKTLKYYDATANRSGVTEGTKEEES